MSIGPTAEESPMPPAIVTITDRHLDDTLQRIERGLEPQWRAQFEFGKTLLTLASAALVFSISLAQLIAPKVAHPRWPILLPVSWVLFCVTVLATAIRQTWAGTAQGFRMGIESRRAEIRIKVAALRPGPDFGEHFDAILADAYNPAIAMHDRAVIIHNRITRVMFWSFASGMVALLTFAILNLPF